MDNVARVDVATVPDPTAELIVGDVHPGPPRLRGQLWSTTQWTTPTSSQSLVPVPRVGTVQGPSFLSARGTSDDPLQDGRDRT